MEFDTTLLASYPEISKCRASVEKNSRVMEYVKNRPKVAL
jgi:hypothetical protein